MRHPGRRYGTGVQIAPLFAAALNAAAIEEWLLELTASPWIFLALFAFATIDGFFPPIPSESAVITLAALWAATGEPTIGLVFVSAALGAFTGDQIAYRIGRRVDPHRIRLFRTERGADALAWAEHTINHRGAAFILAARYIPIGRVAVNLSAGALGYPITRFSGVSTIAAVAWAATGILIGIGSGLWLGDHPVLAVIVGVVVGVLLGMVIDRIMQRFNGEPASPDGSHIPDPDL